MNIFKIYILRANFIYLSVLYALLSGCAVVPVAVVGGTMVVGHAAMGRKGPAAVIDDIKLSSKIISNWQKEGLVPLKILVYEGKVMLCGHCLDSRRYIDLIEGAVKIVDATYQGQTFIDDYMGDKILQAKIKANLLTNSLIQSRNYKLFVLNGVVHVLGTAYTEEEKDALIACVSGMTGFIRFEYDIDIVPGQKNMIFSK